MTSTTADALENRDKVRALPRVPGDFMLHPVAIAAVLLLGLNDHYLKAAYGNWLTGKLSDVSGLIFFPLFLLAALEIARAPFSRSWRAGKVALHLSHGATALIFVSINLYGKAAELYASSMQSVWGCIGPEGASTGYVADATDLLALPFLLIPYCIAQRTCFSESQES